MDSAFIKSKAKTFDDFTKVPSNCVCDKGKFCKYHYSALYYERNKKDILTKQKEKYKEKRQKEHVWALSSGEFRPFSKNDSATPSPKMVVFFGRR